VVEAGREVADVERNRQERRDLRGVTERDETLRGPALIEQLERPRVQTSSARSGELLRSAALDDHDVDRREGQLARQHQTRRATAHDHHSVRRHGPRRIRDDERPHAAIVPRRARTNEKRRPATVVARRRVRTSATCGSAQIA
jgi:hypothetical protein